MQAQREVKILFGQINWLAQQEPKIYFSKDLSEEQT